MAPPADRLPSNPPRGLSNLNKRILSAAVLLPLVIVAIYFGHPYFTILVAVFAGFMAWEWTRIVAHERAPGQTSPSPVPTARIWWAFALVSVATAVLAVLHVGFPFLNGNVWGEIAVGTLVVAGVGAVMDPSRAAWYAAGVVYVSVPAVALVVIRLDPTLGQVTLLWIIALVVLADTGGYLVGRTVGGPKLAPRISPNKTWSGLGGAVLGAAVAGLSVAFVLNHTNVWMLTLISAVLGLLEQGGDLVESAFKRHFGVKDTSQIIPGHGGVLDRVDGLLAVAVAVLAINQWAGGSVLAW